VIISRLTGGSQTGDKAKAPVITPGLFASSQQTGHDLPSIFMVTRQSDVVKTTLVSKPQRAAESNRSG